MTFNFGVSFYIWLWPGEVSSDRFISKLRS
ncbi:hypothetical protein ZOSMA_50G00610 [Zostera marina]|uniref:Uncharacterized protein n=1 Tax=Zostera marina TaxID=29655 RepID=A0A0K9NXY8_ZOSMR|nr:hypothetical protein ZOSMA_50G00610 [Zostera marina]